MKKADVVIHSICSILALIGIIVFFAVLGQDLALPLIIVTVICLVLYFLIFFLMKNAPKVLQRIFKIILEISLVVVIILEFIGVMASKILFYPNFDKYSYDDLTQKEITEELMISSKSGEIYGWLIHNKEENAPIVLYFGGNIENSSSRALDIINDTSEKTTLENCHIAVFDYPGYGKSDGYPSETSLKKFGLETYDYIREKYPNSKIIVMGYSLGTGVANYVSSQRNVDGLILMAAYADGYDLFNSQAPVFYGVLKFFVTYKMESVKFAEDITVKPLLIASDCDEVVPYESSKRLSKAYPNGCDFVTVNGILHSYFWSDSEVLHHISDYINQAES